MPPAKDSQSTMDFIPFLKQSDFVFKKRKRSSLSHSKSVLFANDLSAVILGFGIGLWATGWGAFVMDTLTQTIAFFIPSLTVIVFFQSYHLYSHHFVFSRKDHMVNLFKSFCWSLLTLGLILFLFFWSHLLKNRFPEFLLGLFLATIGGLFLNRFFLNHLLDLLMSIGMALMVVGINDLIFSDGVPIIIDNCPLTFICFLLAVSIVFVSRGFLVHVVFNLWMRRRFRRQLVIAGSDQEAIKISNHIIERNAPFWISGTLGRGDALDLGCSIDKGCLGELKDLPDIVREYDTDDIIVTDENIDKQMLVRILEFCSSVGIEAWFPPKLMPIIDLKLHIDTFCGLPMIRLRSQKNNWIFEKLKHGLDALFTLPGFIILLPLFLLIGLVIKLDSKGSVFYRARAVGKSGRIFKMYKFRSMTENGSREIHKNFVTRLIKGEIAKESADDHPLKITDDPRITRVGKVLRQFSLDELPQLINVLKGDMSLIGPRPCLPYEYKAYKEWHKMRLSIRPGITGIWQVAGRSAVSFEDMVLLDLYYIYNKNLWMDMNILSETISVVLERRGAH